MITFYTTKKLLYDGRHEEGRGDEAGGEEQQGHGAARDDCLGQGLIFGEREDTGKVGLLFFAHLAKYSIPALARLLDSFLFCEVRRVEPVS